MSLGRRFHYVRFTSHRKRFPMVAVHNSKFPPFLKVKSRPNFSPAESFSKISKHFLYLLEFKVATQPAVCTMLRMKMMHWDVHCLAHCFRWTHNVVAIVAHRHASKMNEFAHNFSASMQQAVTVWPIDRLQKVHHAVMDR